MTCKSCHSWNSREFKFCRECGGKLELERDAAAAVDDASPEDAAVQQLLEEAFGQMDAGKHAEALRTAQAALALRPDSAAAHSLLALVYERQGKMSEAIQQLEIAVQQDPEAKADRERLGILKARSGKSASSRRPLTPSQRAMVAAALAGVIVFGVGLGIVVQNGSTGRREARGRGTLRDASAGQTLGVPPGLVGTPPISGIGAPQPGSTATVAPGGAAGQLAGPLSPSQLPSGAGPPPGYDGSAPGLPRVVGQPEPRGPRGLPAAEIGRVEPASQPVEPAEPDAEPRPSDAPAGAGAPALSPVATQPANAVEPSEPAPGFISIEPAAGGAGGAAAKEAAGGGRRVETAAKAPRPAKGESPSISISIGG